MCEIYPAAARIPKCTAKIILYIVDFSPKTEINCHNDLLFSAKKSTTKWIFVIKSDQFQRIFVIKMEEFFSGFLLYF